MSMKNFIAWLDSIIHIEKFISNRKWKWVRREERFKQYLGYCTHGCKNCYKVNCGLRDSRK